MFHFKNESQASGVQNPPAQVPESLITADRQAFSRNYALETQRVILESSESLPDIDALTLHEDEYTTCPADTSNPHKIWSYTPLTKSDAPPRSTGEIPVLFPSAAITAGAGHACPRYKPAMDSLNVVSNATQLNKNARITSECANQILEPAKKDPYIKDEPEAPDPYIFHFGNRLVTNSLGYNPPVVKAPFEVLDSAQVASMLQQDFLEPSIKHEYQEASRIPENRPNPSSMPTLVQSRDIVNSKKSCNELTLASKKSSSLSDGIVDSTTALLKNKTEIDLARELPDSTFSTATVIEQQPLRNGDTLSPDKIAAIDVFEKDSVATSVLGTGSQFVEGYKSLPRTELEGISFLLSSETTVDVEGRASDGERSKTTPNRGGTRSKGVASGSGSSPISNTPFSSSPAFGSDQKGRKRPLGRDGSGGDEDEDEDERPPRSRKLCDDVSDPFTEKRLACPFYLNDPLRYRTTSIGTTSVNDTFQVCAFGAGFKDIKSLKEHLKRRHQPIRCDRCTKDFTTKAELSRHLRVTPVCQVAPEEFTKGMTAEVEEKLKDRKRDGKKLSEEQQAAEIYSWLFPDDPLPVTGFYRDWTVPTPSGAQELELFWDRIEKVLPQRLAARLDANSHLRGWFPVQEYQDATVREIVTELKRSIDEISKPNRNLSVASGSSVLSIASNGDSAYYTNSRNGDGDHNAYDNNQHSLQRQFEPSPQIASWSANDQSFDPRPFSVLAVAQDVGTNPDLPRNDNPPNDWSHNSSGS